MEEAVSYQCSCCSFRCFSWREFYRHQFLTHLNEFNFMMTCFVEGCSQTFRCNSTFVSHLFRKHRGVDLESEAKKSHGSCSRAARLEYQTIGQLEDSVIVDAEEETCNMDVNNVVELDSSEDGQIEVNDVSMVVPVLECHSEPGDRLSHFAAMFLLNAKERYQLTQSSLNFIIQQVQQMTSFTIDDIAEVVHKCFRDQMQGTSETLFTEQLECFRNPFVHVQTEYMQNKYYREHFNLLVSIQK